MTQPTELELRLQEKVLKESDRGARYAKSDRIATCPHEVPQTFHLLGEIGSTRLLECYDCGLVVGVAR